MRVEFVHVIGTKAGLLRGSDVHVAVEGTSRCQKLVKTEIVAEPDEIQSWKCHQVTTPTGFQNASCGAVFDPVRRIVVENSRKVNDGKDIFITYRNEDGSGANEVL